MEAQDVDEAIAARIPGARIGTVEIGPVVELEGFDALIRELSTSKMFCGGCRI